MANTRSDYNSAVTALATALDRDSLAAITSRRKDRSGLGPYLDQIETVLSNLSGLEDFILKADFTITAADLETALQTTAVSILPAPGANKINVPVAIRLAYTFGATAYDDVDLTFRYTGTTNALMVAQEINGGADEEWLLFPILGNGTALSATCVNKAIEVIASADPDSGSDGDGSFTGQILYREVDIS